MSSNPRVFRLVARQGPTKGREYPLTGDLITIGRQPDNSIVIDDSRVSRQHVRLTRHGTSFLLEDLGSGNGTWVNGTRITTPVMLQTGDVIGLSTEVTLALESPTPAVDRTFLLPRRQEKKTGDGKGSVLVFGVGGVVLVAVIVLALAGTLICLVSGGLDPKTAPATPSNQASYPTSTPYPTHTPYPEVAGPEATSPATATAKPGLGETIELARQATVLVVAFIDEEDGYTGSGSVVDPRGYVLTNYHVIEDTNLQFVGLNGPREDEPPETFFEVEIVTVDEDLDLALLHIVADEDGNALTEELSLPTLTVGDSNEVGLGDSVIILGFPGLGHETVTLTKGTVAGFIDDELAGVSRGWIKTDAEINHGNSGGVAINDKGELIGVPTIIFFDEEGSGKIGQLRPINLAGKVLTSFPTKNKYPAMPCVKTSIFESACAGGSLSGGFALPTRGIRIPATKPASR